MRNLVKSKPEDKNKAITDKAKSVFKHLREICAAQAAKHKKLLLWCIVAICAAMLEAHTTGGGSMAMLYMIAENGKKSGRADGNVYMRNGRIRGMAIPSLVQNAYTQPVRSAFSSFSASWRALTQAQQDAWINTKGFFKSDRFARSFEVSGKELYVMLNMNLFNIGQAPISNPPVADSVEGCTGLTLTIDDSANTFSLDFVPAPVPAGISWLIEATGQLSAGVNRPGRSAFRVVTVLIAATASPADINGAYLAKFGAPITGNKIFVRVTPINATTGQAGAAIVAGATVVA